MRLSSLIEELEPFFAEDLVRSEDPAVYRVLRQQVKVPIAVGEQFGDRWDINELVEQHLIDYSRVTIPNVGGLTESASWPRCASCTTSASCLISPGPWRPRRWSTRREPRKLPTTSVQ